MTYALELAKNKIAQQIENIIRIETKDIEISVAPENIKADLAVPLFKLAKKVKKNPTQIAQELAEKIEPKDSYFKKVDATGGFLNFTFDSVKFNNLVIQDFQKLEERYGSSDLGEGKTIVIDFSAPNIAKPFSVGHLRSTIIGQALHNIFSFLGYKVIGDNHIGDWGTQFGKLMYAYKLWGDKEKIASNPIEELLKLYVRFHDEAEKQSKLDDEARAWFKKLEGDDPEAIELWKWFTEVSWKEFERIYDLLDVTFDEVLGESFYNDKLKETVQEALDKGVATWGEVTDTEVEYEEDIPEQTKSEQASGSKSTVVLIDLKKHGIETPLLIQKSDGASLYATRDLATAKYRIKRWNPEQILYVVGGEQQLYFRQWFKALELLGYKTKCVHPWFGLVRLPEGKMSTRKGRVIYLEDVLNEAINRAKKILEDRQLSESEKREIARIIGVGAVKYADLSQNRIKDIVFDWDKMLNMQGDSAPYLQYAYVRIQSILRKIDGDIDLSLVDGATLQDEKEKDLILAISQFPEVVKSVIYEYKPHKIANFVYMLSQKFNTFYQTVPVIRTEDEKLKHTRLYLCYMTGQVIKTGLELLGIKVPQKM